MNKKTLIGELKLINTMTTITSITQKLMKGFPSFVRKVECSNTQCIYGIGTQDESTITTFNVLDDLINLQNEIYYLFLPSNDYVLSAAIKEI